MNAREKIINAIEKAKKQSEKYAQDRIIVPFKEVDMIIALLKEQKAVKPKIDAFGHPYCPKCKILVYETWEFCPHCGVKMEWR